MTLAELIAEDLAEVFDTDTGHAQTVAYAGTDIPAIVVYGEDMEERAGAVATATELRVRASDVARPGYRDAVVIGSDTYYVERILSGDGYAWTVGLMTDERPTFR